MIAMKIFGQGPAKKKSGKKEKSGRKLYTENVQKMILISAQELSSMLLTSEPVAGSEKNRKAVSPASVIR